MPRVPMPRRLSDGAGGSELARSQLCGLREEIACQHSGRWAGVQRAFDTVLEHTDHHMAQTLTSFLESHAEVFCTHVLPQLHLLSLRSAAGSCKLLHALIRQSHAATLDQVRHNTWLLAHQKFRLPSGTHVSITHDTGYPCAASRDNQLAAFMSGNNLLTIVRWQEPGHIVAQVPLPHFHKVPDLQNTCRCCLSRPSLSSP